MKKERGGRERGNEEGKETEGKREREGKREKEGKRQTLLKSKVLHGNGKGGRPEARGQINTSTSGSDQPCGQSSHCCPPRQGDENISSYSYSGSK